MAVTVLVKKIEVVDCKYARIYIPGKFLRNMAPGVAGYSVRTAVMGIHPGRRVLFHETTGNGPLNGTAMI